MGISVHHMISNAVEMEGYCREMCEIHPRSVDSFEADWGTNMPHTNVLLSYWTIYLLQIFCHFEANT